MIIWDLNPVAFSIGPLAVRWYGIVYALGFLLGYYVLRVAARSKRIPNLTERLAEDYLLWLMIGSIVVSRITYIVVYDFAYYLARPAELFAVWHGGLSIHGGLLGAILVTIWFCKRHRISFYKMADILVVPLAFVLIFGRIANYVNGELFGRKTNVSWCVQFPGADGCRHPSQIYEALYSYVLFWILFAMEQTKRFVDGVIFWSFIFFYGVFRFLITFWREYDPTDPAFLSLSLGQWLSLAMVMVAIWWFVSRTPYALVKNKA